MRVPASSCCRHGALMKSCHGVACVPGEIRGRMVFGGGSTIYSLACQAHSRVLVCMVYFRPDTREVTSGETLREIQLDTSPISSRFRHSIVFTIGFATKTKFSQLRSLAIGSYATLLAAGFSSTCHFDECLRVSLHNPC